MKRTRHINLQRLRKRPTRLLQPLAIAVTAATLSACGGQESADIYQSLEQCQRQRPDQAQTCETAYQQAQQDSARTAPKYASRADCEAEFSAEQCIPVPEGQTSSSHSGGWFMPAMTGFLLGRALNSSPQVTPLYSSNSHASPLYGRMTTADGQVVAHRGQTSTQVNPNVYDPKPTTTRTTSRGGFGMTARNRSSSSSSGGYSSFGG